MAATFVDVRWLLKLFFNLMNISFARFVTLFWPKKVKASKLEEIHAKMVMKEAGDSNLKKPRLGTGVSVKTNGSSVPASSSVRSNGKSHR